MKKSLIGLVLVAFAGVVSAQSTGTVVQSQCRNITQESLVGAGVGAAAGVVAGKALSSMFGLGRTGDKIAAIAGGAVGGMAGNAIATEKQYSCTLLINYKGNNVLHTGTFPQEIKAGNVLSVTETTKGEYYVNIR